jgi:type I restriction enzyme S subunit
MSDLIKTSLHEIIEEPISGTRPRGGVDFEGDFPSFGGENVTMTGGLNFYPVKKVSADFFHQMRRGKLRELDVLINKDGANTGKSAIYRNSPYRYACVNEHLFILRGKPSQLDQIYLHYFLQFSDNKRKLESKITGSAQPGLNSAFCHNFPVEIAPLPEQKTIASILTSVDEVIENTQKQIAKLQDLKKATMYELLTKGIGHTEFKDSELGRIPKEWEVNTLRDLSSKVGSGVTPRGGSSVYQEEGIIFIRSQNVHFSGLNLEDVAYISEEIHLGMKGSRVHGGDVLLNITGASIGRCAVVPEVFPEANVNQHVCIIRPLNQLSNSFLGVWLSSDFGQNQIMRFQAGGNREGLNFEQIRSIRIPIPDIFEQREISDVISSINSSSQSIQEKLSQTQSLKKSLMQDLLTGKVRVN